MKVKDCMFSVRSDEYVKEDDTLETAIHQLVMGNHRSLLVTREDSIVGVLRLSDIFQQIAEACRD